MALNYLRQYVKVDKPEVEVPREGRPLAVEHLLARATSTTAAGSCFVADSALHHDDRHGSRSLGSLAQISASRLSMVTRDPDLAFADLSRAVFLDTETTGLSMGTGTYVFLVGAGYLDGDVFRVKQFFLNSPGDEEPFLEALHEFLRPFTTLVTFNGKAFDWPLLQNRFVRHRAFRRSPLNDPPHLDLLHPARRLWKRRLASCALSALERDILGIRRTAEDVPGWMIPALYFAYLRHGDGRDLQGVFYHNKLDILSLAALAIHIDHILADPLGGMVSHGQDFLSLGTCYRRAGEQGPALACYDHALRYQLSTDERGESWRYVAAIHKHERQWEAANRAWEQMIAAGGAWAIDALVERAKYLEHVERQYLEALDDVQQAFTLLDLHPDLAETVDANDLARRRARLLNRAYRHRSWAT